jgi:Icc-related predicted phosphoesterase
VKVIYTSDLHGNTRLYEELHELVRSSIPHIIALGGDLLPSFPPTKRYEDMIPNQKIFIDQFLRPFFRRVTDTTPVQWIFLIPGNWDLGYAHLFKGSVERVIDLDRKGYRLHDGYELIGYPFVPPSPFRPKDFEKMDDREAPWPPQKNPSYVRSPENEDELTPIDPHLYLRERETIREDLARLVRPQDTRKAIYLMHSPPYGTSLDVILGGNRVGSQSIKTWIQEAQPLLTLHGHIHESPELSGAYWDRIGQTISINPGQSAWTASCSSRLYAVTFELEKIEETLSHTRLP